MTAQFSTRIVKCQGDLQEPLSSSVFPSSLATKNRVKNTHSDPSEPPENSQTQKKQNPEIETTWKIVMTWKALTP